MAKGKTPDKKIIEEYCRLIEKHTGLCPYPEQVQAAAELYKGNIVDMKTGEGKTLAVFMAVLLVAREGRKVFVVTSNDYLSERDYKYSKELLAELGYKSISLKASVGGTENQYAENDVIYATGETLIFDYLRGIPVEYDFAIIDEIDYILVESANHDFSVSTNDEHQVRMPVDLFKMCKSITNVLTYAEKKSTAKRVEYYFDMQYESDVIIDRVSRTAEITEIGYRKLKEIIGDELENTVFMEILLATLQAKHFYIKDINYIVNNGEIVIINDSSGRLSIGGSNDICIQTAIEVKEGVSVTAKALLHNTCSYPVFFSIFKELTGISGTTSYVPYDFETIYSKAVKKIREHKKNQREEIYKYFKDDRERMDFIAGAVRSSANPILVVADSDKRAEEIKERLIGLKGKRVMILDNDSLAQEEQFLEDIKTENAVLISSKIVGRGTDIDLPEKFENGLTVIVAQRFLSKRAEMQVIGRTGRNGKKGTCYILTSHDDILFHLEYKSTAGRKKQWKKEKYIGKLQNRYEQRMFDSRKHIYARSKLFFDQDRAIKETLGGFNSYDEILKFAVDFGEGEEREKAIGLLNKAIEQKYIYVKKAHGALLQKRYGQIRPFFQQQFLQYNDMMAQTLYETEGFQHRCKEYVQNGRNVVLAAVNSMLEPIIGKDGAR